jgi:hypothetical protein
MAFNNIHIVYFFDRTQALKRIIRENQYSAVPPVLLFQIQKQSASSPCLLSCAAPMLQNWDAHGYFGSAGKADPPG